MVDKNKDTDGYVQFIADFNKGLFACTNTPNSKLEYHPNNSKLENTFTYGSGRNNVLYLFIKPRKMPHIQFGCGHFSK